MFVCCYFTVGLLYNLLAFVCGAWLAWFDDDLVLCGVIPIDVQLQMLLLWLWFVICFGFLFLFAWLGIVDLSLFGRF